ncbi:MAG: hypothetical protein JEY96_19655 [Bacteroidales bacterium]|nr:hypothetical protein [Bacteroidales bacterium]
MRMLEAWKNLDTELKVVIISAGTSFLIFIIGWLIKSLHDKYSFNYKLKREYMFKQQKNIQEEIAKTKTLLLNSSEEVNYRLWNFIFNISENWHSIEESKWLESKHYYLRSFVYRILVFIFWILETEKSILSFDSTVANKKDNYYLKFVKTFKHIFCDIRILKELDYENNSVSNHFYANELPSYAKYVSNNNGGVIDYDEFYEKAKKDYSKINKLFIYINEMTDNENDKNWNVLRCYHLLILEFLNNFGHDYQKTNKKKMKFIFDKYKTIKIKKGFYEFIKKNKIEKKLKSVINGIYEQSRFKRFVFAITFGKL